MICNQQTNYKFTIERLKSVLDYLLLMTQTLKIIVEKFNIIQRFSHKIILLLNCKFSFSGETVTFKYIINISYTYTSIDPEEIFTNDALSVFCLYLKKGTRQQKRQLKLGILEVLHNEGRHVSYHHTIKNR